MYPAELRLRAVVNDFTGLSDEETWERLQRYLKPALREAYLGIHFTPEASDNYEYIQLRYPKRNCNCLVAKALQHITGYTSVRTTLGRAYLHGTRYKAIIYLPQNLTKAIQRFDNIVNSWAEKNRQHLMLGKRDESKLSPLEAN